MWGGIVLVFYLNYLANDEKISDFNISFKKKLTKSDKNFIKFLLNYYSEKKEIFIEIPKSKLKNLLQVEEVDEMTCFLDKFMQAKIYFSFRDRDNYLYQGAFHILDSYFLQKDNVILVLSKEILLSFDSNNLFSKINLRCILDFECSNSVNIYLKLLNLHKNQEEGFMDFYLEELKELLEISNSYERFYDFEKKVLEPLIKDLNVYSEYEVSYSKIKKSEGTSSKILGIKLHYVNKKIRDFRKQSNELLIMIKDKVENFDLVYNNIFETLKSYGYKYVYENLNYIKIKENKKKDYKNFDKQVIEALKENLAYVAKKENSGNNFVVEKILKTTNEIQEEINNALVKLGLEEFLENNLFFSSLITRIYNIRDGENYEFQSHGIKIKIFYNKKVKSKIEVEKL